MAACKVVQLSKLLGDLSIYLDDRIVIHCDNMSSIQLAKNPILYAQTKHIEVHYHFICERVLAGDISLVYVSTQDQVADIFTKDLGTKKLHGFWSILGLHDMLSLRGSVEMSRST